VKPTQWSAWKFGAVLAAAFVCAPAVAADPSLLFIADAQMHNVVGGQVKQTWSISDWFSGVAQRHPEMNLLSAYALQDAIRRGKEQAESGAPPYIVMLGDATNAACTSEYERFRNAVTAGDKSRLVLMAHGNHDSYLMGTVNYWQAPLDQRLDLSPFQKPVLPVDGTWWPARAQKVGAEGLAWAALCDQGSTRPSVPMNKIQWMAKYLESLKRTDGNGVPELELTPGPSDATKASFSGKGRPGTLLGALRYRVVGEWIRPTATERGLSDTYDSFLVQAVDVGNTHRLILVDTAACGWYDHRWYQRWPVFWWQNAGTHACLREAQQNAIGALLADSGGRTVVFAGHHPLKDFAEGDRAAFERLMQKASGPAWTYVSAHTHDPYTDQDRSNQGAHEINISSTTDWPMSAALIRFGQSVHGKSLPMPEPGIAYSPPDQYQNGPELCRHLAAARKLASPDLSLSEARYESPGKHQDYVECVNDPGSWERYQGEILAAERTIADKMSDKDNEKYRQRILDIMAAASKHERGTFSWDKKIH